MTARELQEILDRNPELAARNSARLQGLLSGSGGGPCPAAGPSAAERSPSLRETGRSRRGSTRPPVPRESEEQVALAHLLDTVLPGEWCHVPNGEWRHVATAKRLAGMGVKAGIPDVLIFRRPPSDPSRVGVAIELKRSRGGRETPEQSVALEMLRRNGWIAEVCHGCREAEALLRRCGYLTGRSR